MQERTHSNTRYAIRDGNRSQTRATRERTHSNTRYAIRDQNRSQTRATRERLKSNFRYAIRDSNRSQTRAILESTTSNTRYWSVKDYCSPAIFIGIANNSSTKRFDRRINNISIRGSISDDIISYVLFLLFNLFFCALYQMYRIAMVVIIGLYSRSIKTTYSYSIYFINTCFCRRPNPSDIKFSFI